MEAFYSRRKGLLRSSSAQPSLQMFLSIPKRWAHELEVEKMPPTSCDHCFSSSWKKVDSKAAGVRRSAIAIHAWKVLGTLRKNGFDAFLVGGCVRDFLLKRTPKDFDIIADASLEKIKKCFRGSRIVGRNFPICRVHIGGFITEVSSFQTTRKGTKERDAVQCPKTCDKKGLVLWQNSMCRDFTINSLFYDPYKNIIYDYVNGMRDIKFYKVRTVTPAYESFQEDNGRILRGLRIAARLHMKFSNQTATALRDLSSSILTLDKTKLLMELNFMLAYGSAGPSISLLQKFNILELLLPIQAAYLVDQTKQELVGRSSMLMELFARLDKTLSADRPNSHLWVALLALHLAFLDHPRDPIIVLSFASIFYYGNWSKAVEFARENVHRVFRFVPEVSESSSVAMSDESLLEEVSRLASLASLSAQVFRNSNAIKDFMRRYPDHPPHSELVIVNKNLCNRVRNLFSELEGDVKLYDKKRMNFAVNYKLLMANDPDETRYVLGKIVVAALIDGDDDEGGDVLHHHNDSRKS